MPLHNLMTFQILMALYTLMSFHIHMPISTLMPHPILMPDPILMPFLSNPSPFTFSSFVELPVPSRPVWSLTYPLPVPYLSSLPRPL